MSKKILKAKDKTLKATNVIMFENKRIVPLYYSLRENGETYAKTNEDRPVWEWLGIAITNIIEKQIFVKNDKDNVINKEWLEIEGEQYKFVEQTNLSDSITLRDEYKEHIKMFSDIVKILNEAEGKRLTRVLLRLSVKTWRIENMPVLKEIIKDYDLEEIYMDGWNSLDGALSKLNFELNQNVETLELMFNVLRDHGYIDKLNIPKLTKLVKNGCPTEKVLDDLYYASFFMLAIGSHREQELLQKEIKNNFGQFKESLLSVLNIDGNYPEDKIDFRNLSKAEDMHEILYNYMAYKYVYFVTEDERNKLKDVVGQEIAELSSLLTNNLTSKKFDPGIMIWVEMAKDFKEILVKINEFYKTTYDFNVKDLYKEIIFDDRDGCILVNKDVLLNILLINQNSENKPFLTEMIGESLCFSDTNHEVNVWIKNAVKVKKRYKQLNEKINDENENEIKDEIMALMGNNGLDLQIRMSAIKSFYELNKNLNIKTKIENGVFFIDKSNMKEIYFSYKIDSEMEKGVLKKLLWKSLTKEFGSEEKDIVEAQEMLMLADVKKAKPLDGKRVLKF